METKIPSCWLKEWDKNTKYFHAKASTRKRKNKIWGIVDSQGNWTVKGEEVEGEFCEYFTSLFSTTRPYQNQLDAALEEIAPRVTEKINDQLQQPFTEEEIFEALSHMCPTKAPGPNGFPAAFYQKYWKMIKSGVVTTCLDILNKQGTITPLNHTYIALVPKA